MKRAQGTLEADANGAAGSFNYLIERDPQRLVVVLLSPRYVFAQRVAVHDGRLKAAVQKALAPGN